MADRQVLVVEDNEKNMKLFRDVLQATGYSTLEATTGEDAVELALSQEPALVLMDVQLPGIDDIQQANDIATRQAKLEIKIPDAANQGQFKSMTPPLTGEHLNATDVRFDHRRMSEWVVPTT